MDIQILLFIIFVMVFILMKIGKAKGYLIKVEYSHSKKFSYAVVCSLAVSMNFFIRGDVFYLFLGIIFGVAIYSRKHFLGLKSKKS
ncbi:hypothetical protein CMT41_17750 [Colwellia sp. MT41]|uniref:Uncharacterized protein n=1 Tax=Colwellia marinimaniae TaxID=1513592 RepID=A0ABQ0N027_9GAMM|nr:hypothetical protein CMT41_17750 [Colwellia sp. MT41]GAW97940.1 hypothetical protein MTCD1_03595 [Colwellia marinimaniae]